MSKVCGPFVPHRGWPVLMIVTALWLGTCATSAIAGALCGNGVVEGGEECDDGGICIGGSNAGTQCTKESDCIGSGVCVDGPKVGAACDSDAACPGGLCTHCKTFGGDGCAANCSVESVLSTYVTPNSANENVWAFPFRLGNSVPLIVGKERNGRIPVVIKAGGLQFPPLQLATLVCACWRGAVAKSCGGTLLERDGVTPSLDCTLDDSVCTGKSPCTFVNGMGNSAAGVIACDGLEGVDVTFTPRCSDSIDGPQHSTSMQLGGAGGPGSATLFVTTTIGSVFGSCEGGGAEYGPDGQFCTADDPVAARGTPSTQPFVTGTAAAVACETEAQSCTPWSICSLLLTAIEPPGCACCPPDRPCYSGREPCFSPCSVAGTPFRCSELAHGNAVGACLVSAYAALASAGRGTVRLCISSAPSMMPTPLAPPTPTPRPCIGDCDGDGIVTVNEVIKGINVAFGIASVSVCPAAACCGPDCLASGTSQVSINCLIEAVNNALVGCGNSGETAQ